jgi:hypothetical protein
MGKTVKKNGPTLSQILLSVVDKTAIFERQRLHADSHQPAATWSVSQDP